MNLKCMNSAIFKIFSLLCLSMGGNEQSYRNVNMMSCNYFMSMYLFGIFVTVSIISAHLMCSTLFADGMFRSLELEQVRA